MAKLFLALGSNLGDGSSNINRAIAFIERKIGRVSKVSNFYKTAPEEFISDSVFTNATIEVETQLPVYRVLKITQKIEFLMGRTCKSLNGVYADRVIDIDILLYGKYRLKTRKLSVPHPKMLQRSFVMEPLRDIMTEKQIKSIVL